MLLSEISVKRPVFACVLSLILVCFGILSFRELSLREYPQIDPPIVTVQVDYPGAPANIVETRITQLLENQISGVEGIDSIESTSRDGRSSVTIEFSIDRDIDAAANDVRDRISRIQDNLPDEAESPEVKKVDSSNDVIIWQNLASDQLSVPELTDYARRYLVDQYSTLEGVAVVRVGGAMNYALRIWPDRLKMSARGITVSDIENALRAENVELPSGAMESDQMLFKGRIKRNFKTAEDFEKIVLGTGEDGHLIRLGEIARVELGVVEDRTFFRGNGVPMVGIGVIRQSTANTIEVANAVKKLSAKLNKNLPEGMSIEQSYDASVFISASIKEVYQTLFVAIICVVIVLYLFLRNIRAMLIPAVTVPVSLIATFILIYALGFSINILTLLAMILAIGIVVDDAIVMIENIVRRIQDYGETPLVAAYRGSKQVGFAIVATTLVLIAVFIPFHKGNGDIGRLFTEFAITISVCVIFSSLVALTLCPMLASVWVKRSSTKQDTKAGIFMRIRATYLKTLQWILRLPVLVVIAFLLLVGMSYWGYSKLFLLYRRF